MQRFLSLLQRSPQRDSADHRPAERGAVLVEYTLILAVFVLVSVGAVGVMNDNADAYFEDSSDHIGSPINRFDLDEDGNRPGANTLASTTTVTAPPTTSTTTTTTTTSPPATTTTTIATTTTTSPATTTTFVTTTTQPSSMSTTLADESIPHPTKAGKWRGVGKVTVIGSVGVDVSGVSVSASLTRSNGTVLTRSCQTDATGVCYIYKKSVNSGVEYWDLDLTSVSGSVPWVGTESSVRLMNPL